jgi:hypothetical protein
MLSKQTERRNGKSTPAKLEAAIPQGAALTVETSPLRSLILFVTPAHNHLVLGDQISLFRGLPNQALGEGCAAGVLGKLLACALCAVPLLVPVSRVISAQERP